MNALLDLTRYFWYTIAILDDYRDIDNSLIHSNLNFDAFSKTLHSEQFTYPTDYSAAHLGNPIDLN